MLSGINKRVVVVSIPVLDAKPEREDMRGGRLISTRDRNSLRRMYGQHKDTYKDNLLSELQQRRGSTLQEYHAAQERLLSGSSEQQMEVAHRSREEWNVLIERNVKNGTLLWIYYLKSRIVKTLAKTFYKWKYDCRNETSKAPAAPGIAGVKASKVLVSDYQMSPQVHTLSLFSKGNISLEGKLEDPGLPETPVVLAEALAIINRISENKKNDINVFNSVAIKQKATSRYYTGGQSGNSSIDEKRNELLAYAQKIIISKKSSSQESVAEDVVQGKSDICQKKPNRGSRSLSPDRGYLRATATAHGRQHRASPHINRPKTAGLWKPGSNPSPHSTPSYMLETNASAKKRAPAEARRIALLQHLHEEAHLPQHEDFVRSHPSLATDHGSSHHRGQASTRGLAYSHYSDSHDHPSVSSVNHDYDHGSVSSGGHSAPHYMAETDSHARKLAGESVRHHIQEQHLHEEAHLPQHEDFVRSHPSLATDH